MPIEVEEEIDEAILAESIEFFRYNVAEEGSALQNDTNVEILMSSTDIDLQQHEHKSNDSSPPTPSPHSDDSVPDYLVPLTEIVKVDKPRYIMIGKLSINKEGKKKYGGRGTCSLSDMSVPRLKDFSLIMPDYLVNDIAPTMHAKKGWMTQDFDRYLRHHVRYFALLDIDLPVDRMVANEEQLLPGIIDQAICKYADRTLFDERWSNEKQKELKKTGKMTPHVCEAEPDECRYRANGEIKHACVEYMKRFPDATLDFFCKRMKMWEAMCELTFRIVEELEKKGFKPFVFFTGGRGFRVFWYDPTLFFWVDHKERYAVTFEKLIAPGYFGAMGVPDIIQHTDKNVWDRNKGVKPDVDAHPESGLFPKTIDPHNWHNAQFLSYHEDDELSHRIVRFWKTELPALLPERIRYLDASLANPRPDRVLPTWVPRTRPDGSMIDEEDALAKIRTTKKRSRLAASDDSAYVPDAEGRTHGYTEAERIEAAKCILAFIKMQPWGKEVTNWTKLEASSTTAVDERTGMTHTFHGFIICFPETTYCELRPEGNAYHSNGNKVLWYCNMDTRKFHQMCMSANCARVYQARKDQGTIRKYPLITEEETEHAKRMQNTAWHTWQNPFRSDSQQSNSDVNTPASTTSNDLSDMDCVAALDAAERLRRTHVWQETASPAMAAAVAAAVKAGHPALKRMLPLLKRLKALSAQDEAKITQQEHTTSTSAVSIASASAASADAVCGSDEHTSAAAATEAPNAVPETMKDERPERDPEDVVPYDDMDKYIKQEPLCADETMQTKEDTPSRSAATVVAAAADAAAADTAAASSIAAARSQKSTASLPIPPPQPPAPPTLQIPDTSFLSIPVEKRLTYWNEHMQAPCPVKANNTVGDAWMRLPEAQKWEYWRLHLMRPPMQRFMNAVIRGENAVLEGGPGCGKSVSWEATLFFYRWIYPDRVILNLASYGVAAGQLHGHTLHSWGGFGLKTYGGRGELAERLRQLWHEVRSEVFPTRAIERDMRHIVRMRERKHITAAVKRETTGLFPAVVSSVKSANRSGKSRSLASFMTASASSSSSSTADKATTASGELTALADRIASENTKTSQRYKNAMDLSLSLLTRWRNVDVVVLGEFSCTDPRHLDFLSMTASIARGNSAPFGGLQVVIHGDRNQRKPIFNVPLPHHVPKTIWTMKLWQHLFPLPSQQIRLVEPQRQADDPKFAAIVERLTYFQLTADDIQFLKGLCREFPPGSTFHAPYLFPTREQVHTRNAFEIKRMVEAARARNAKVYEYPATLRRIDNGCPIRWTESIQYQLNVSPSLVLCEGAPCMYSQNVDPLDQIYNGSLIFVADFQAPLGGTERGDPDEFPVIYFPGQTHRDKTQRTYVQYYITRQVMVKPDGADSRPILAELRYLPFELAFAHTIDKVQGLTLEGARMAIDKRMKDSHERLIVGLSRVKTSDRLQFTTFDESVLQRYTPAGAAAAVAAAAEAEKRKALLQQQS